MINVIILGIGLFIGAFIGFILSAVLAVGKNSDESATKSFADRLKLGVYLDEEHLGSNKLAYQFYRRDRNGEDQFIGTLTEKRKKPERITYASIMNWAKHLAPKDVIQEVYFHQVEIQSEAWQLQK